MSEFNAKVPLDLQIEQQQLAQRQALANAILQRAFTPNMGQQVGQHYAAPSGAAAIGAPIAQALMAKQMMKRNDAQARDMADRYRNMPLAAGEEKFGHTPVKMQVNGQLTDVLIGDRGTVKPIQGMAPAVKKEATAGGQLYDPYSGAKGEWLGEQYGPDQVVNGEVVQRDLRSGKAHQVANRPSQVNVKASATTQGESEFLKGLGKDTAEMVTTARKGKQQGQMAIDIAGQLEKLDQQGVFSGPTANVATTLGAFAQSLGVPVDEAKIGRSEQYNSVLAQQIAKILTDGSLGRTFTNEDRIEFMKQFPQLISSPEGRKFIIGRMRQAATKDIDYADQVEKNLGQTFPEAQRLFQVAPSTQPFPVQPGSQPPSAAPMSLDDYLKSKRGGR